MLVEGGFRRETPRNLLPRENKGRCRARAWLVPGAPRRPPGPGDFLLCPLEPGSVHTGTPAPHLALAETTQTVRYDITCFRAGERDRYSRLLLFLKVRSRDQSSDELCNSVTTVITQDLNYPKYVTKASAASKRKRCYSLPEKGVTAQPFQLQQILKDELYGTSLRTEKRMSTAKRTPERSYTLWDHDRSSKHQPEKGTLGPAWEVVLCAAESRLPGATGLCSVTAPAGPVSGAGPVFGFMRTLTAVRQKFSTQQQGDVSGQEARQSGGGMNQSALGFCSTVS
ncbi:unnamed protein product [Rangifer tarandus platyrhynchus]|uniref:Uncharacterized protein n=2 Tax=Rangifer tarandus platyrhynchus TaxID=3082113 RepID=A0ACB0DTS7_RANTA|nr:unnamed protein product [Rangifer tarandus platyrhynchus]CAI9691632.1 unnamed protein product [Rangifer tarandus platyrhynchus]